MKPIFIRKNNFNLEEFLEALERKTSVVSRHSKQSPMKMWMRVSNVSAINCDSDGLTFCAFNPPTVGKEIHCMDDFVATVKEQFPKKEEDFFVNLAFVNRKKLLKEIEKTSSICWCSGNKPTGHLPINEYLQTRKGALVASSTGQGKTELTPVQFIEKCAELHPPKSVYDDLRKGDVCLVKDRDIQSWRLRMYVGDGKFASGLNDKTCNLWKQVKPTGVNVYDVLKGEN